MGVYVNNTRITKNVKTSIGVGDVISISTDRKIVKSREIWNKLRHLSFTLKCNLNAVDHSNAVEQNNEIIDLSDGEEDQPNNNDIDDNSQGNETDEDEEPLANLISKQHEENVSADSDEEPLSSLLSKLQREDVSSDSDDKPLSNFMSGLQTENISSDSDEDNQPLSNLADTSNVKKTFASTSAVKATSSSDYKPKVEQVPLEKSTSTRNSISPNTSVSVYASTSTWILPVVFTPPAEQAQVKASTSTRNSILSHTSVSVHASTSKSIPPLLYTPAVEKSEVKPSTSSRNSVISNTSASTSTQSPKLFRVHVTSPVEPMVYIPENRTADNNRFVSTAITNFSETHSNDTFNSVMNPISQNELLKRKIYFESALPCVKIPKYSHPNETYTLSPKDDVREINEIYDKFINMIIYLNVDSILKNQYCKDIKGVKRSSYDSWEEYER